MVVTATDVRFDRFLINYERFIDSGHGKVEVKVCTQEFGCMVGKEA